VYDLAIGFAGSGHTVVVVCTDSGGRMAERLRTTGGVFVEILSPLRKEDAYRKIISSYQIDVVNCHFSAFGAAIAHDMSVPVISCIHNIYTWLSTDILDEFRSVDRFIHKYVAVSEDAARFVEKKMNIPAGKIEVIPNGIDLDCWTRRKRTAVADREKFGIGDNDYLFVSVGSITRVKGQDRILRVMPDLLEMCPDIRVMFIGGNSDPPFYDYLQHIVEEYDLSRAVRFLDFTDDVSRFYVMADAFVLPSLIEGWSIAMLEAMFHGLPVIMTDIAGFKTVMKDREAGIALPAPYGGVEGLDKLSIEKFSFGRDDPMLRPLAEAMLRFCREREFWRDIGEGNARYVRTCFDIKRTVRATENLFFKTVMIFSRSKGRKYDNLKQDINELSDVLKEFAAMNRNARLLETYVEWHRSLVDRFYEQEKQLQTTINLNRRLEDANRQYIEDINMLNREVSRIPALEAEVSRIPAIEEEKNRLLSNIAEISREKERLDATFSQLEARYKVLSCSFEEIISSTSWKMTAPIRSVITALKCIFRRI
jgi:glycosyltransferase involved in cell wall biosynthesis